MLNKYIWIAIALAFTTLLGLYQVERMARARAELAVAESKAVAIDLEQEAHEAKLGRLSAEGLVAEAQKAARLAREAMAASTGGEVVETPEGLITPAKAGSVAENDGYWATSAFVIQCTACLKQEPIRRTLLKESLVREAKALNKLERSQRATKFWSKAAIAMGAGFVGYLALNK